MGSKLVGCGSAVPNLLISNDDLAQIVETSDEWISVRTGIRNRRVLTGTILSKIHTYALIAVCNLDINIGHCSWKIICLPIELSKQHFSSTSDEILQYGSPTSSSLYS